MSDQASASRRGRLHQRARAVLGARPGHDVDELARHSFAAIGVGDPLLAADDAERAANAAVAGLAVERAAALYAQGLDALGRIVAAGDPGPHEQRRVRLLIGLGRVTQRIDDGRGTAILAEAAGAAGALGDGDLMAEAVLARFGRNLAPDPAYVALLEGTLARLDGATSRHRVALLCRLALDILETDTAGRARALADEAVSAARLLDEPALLGRALLAWSTTHRAVVPAGARRRVTEEAIQAAIGAGDLPLAIDARAAELFDLLEAGEIAVVLEDRLPAQEERGRLGWSRVLWQAGFLRAALTVHLGMGRGAPPAEVEQEFEALAGAAAAAGVAAGLAEAGPTLLGGRIGLRWYQRRLGELRGPLEQIVGAYPGVEVWRAILACALTDGGDLDAAADLVADIVGDGLDRLPQGQMYLPSLAFLTRPVVALGWSDVAAEVARRCAPFAGQLVVVGAGIIIMGPVDAFRIELLSVAERP